MAIKGKWASIWNAFTSPQRYWSEYELKVNKLIITVKFVI